MNLISADEQALTTLEDIANEASLQVVQSYGRFKQALIMASAVRQMEQTITNDMMNDIMALQGTSLGFRTDKDNAQGYPIDTVKRCFIEATIRGVRAVGNEFNIITGKCYITKEGYSRLVREWPGLTNLRLMPGVPATSSGGALVPFRATWEVDGKPDSIDRVKGESDDTRIPVKVNSGMGADAILGKATRKILAAIYGQLTGMHEALPDGDASDVANGSGPRRSAITDDIEGAPGAAEQDDIRQQELMEMS